MATGATPGFDDFVDLDGDGLPDHITTVPLANAPVRRRAWLNDSDPPVIWEFPNGLAAKTRVSYEAIFTKNGQSGGSAAVYTDTGTLVDSMGAKTRPLKAPLRVVYFVATDNGVGPTSNVSYQYFDLRASPSGYGPQGFAKTVTTEQASGTVTTTTYAQSYPYTGKPTKVERSISTTLEGTGTAPPTSVVVPITKTETVYKNVTIGAGVPVFVHPETVTDVSYLQGSVPDPTGASVPLMTITTGFTYDETCGNPQSVTVTTTSSATGESYRKVTAYTYPTDGGGAQKMGKPTQVEVTTTQLSSATGIIAPELKHKTGFEYGPSPTYKLTTTKVEEGSPTQLWTVYDYDDLGNVTTTMSCASDFDQCVLGGSNGADGSDPAHPPFRTTTVNYDPWSFITDPGGFTGRYTPYHHYEYGRYPVKTTNPANFVQYSVYDPLYGTLIQSSDPNGVQTCTVLDAFGRNLQVIERCGSPHELTTSITRQLSANLDTSQIKLIVGTTPPSGATTWIGSDSLGRTVKTSTRHFSGSFTTADTAYDNVGRIFTTSQPYLPGEAQHLTTNHYDWMGRTDKITQDLGFIGGDTPTASAEVTTTFGGVWIKTTSQVNGQSRDRTEYKNALGKVSEVYDAKSQVIAYTYDVDGNLVGTLDGRGNEVVIGYDQRGRKTSTTDPDLGTWGYTYDGFGNLLTQTDAKHQVTQMTYDVLGRMTTRTDSAGTAQWVYDLYTPGGFGTKGTLSAMVGAPDPNLRQPCTIPHVTQTSGNRAGRSYLYTQYGGDIEVDECVDSETFTTTYQYDDVHGRQSGVTYPQVSDHLRSDLQLYEPRVPAVCYRCVGQQGVLGGQGHQRRGTGDRRIHEKRRRDRVHAQPIDGVVARRYHDSGCGQQHGDPAVEQHLRRSRELAESVSVATIKHGRLDRNLRVRHPRPRDLVDRGFGKLPGDRGL